MQANWKATWASKVAGILCTVAGVIGIIGAASLLVKGLLVGVIGEAAESMIPFISKWLSSWPVAADITAIIGGALDVASDIIVAIGAILLTFGIITLTGGIFALLRRAWRFALVGSILAIASSLPLGVVAIILTSLSRDEFKA